MSLNFEFGDRFKVTDRKGLEPYLASIYKDYKNLWLNDDLEEEINDTSVIQPFLSFDGEYATPRNYVGFIKFQEEETIKIYPKVFKQMAVKKEELMHRHLFFWFKYCKRIKFPFNPSTLDNYEIEDLPELIIYLISRQFHETISTQPYHAYENVEEALITPRGIINFTRYSKNISFGNYHLIDCDYEPFIFDNKINRIIKYCIRLLQSKTRNINTSKILNDSIFILDDVEDAIYNLDDLKQIRISNFFVEYLDLMKSCEMILGNKVYSHAEYEMKNWSLLFPMEFVFEDFISGFITDYFSDEFNVYPQKSNLYLHQNPNIFNLKHDILLTDINDKPRFIIDTKYKPRWNLNQNDLKRGVSQSDMYQMISYAYRRGIDKVILMYPNTSSKLSDDFVFKINEAGSEREIKIKAIDVPFWSLNGTEDVKEKLLWKLNSTLRDDF